MQRASRFSRIAVLVLTSVTAAAGLAITATPASSFEDVLPSENPIDITPRILNNASGEPSSQARSIAQLGNRVVIGGSFRQIQNYNSSTILDQRYLFSFNPSTGLIDQSFDPVLNGEVTTVLAHPDGDKVYVAGAFSRVDGDVHSRVVLLNLSNGNPVTTFDPPTISAEVTSMKLANGRLYIGGNFATIGNTDRRALAALDPNTGALTDHLQSTISGTLFGDGSPSVKAFDITPDGSKLVAIGNFRTVDGQERVQLAIWNTGGAIATLRNWATQKYGDVCNQNFETYMRDVDIAPNGRFFVAVTTGSYQGGPPNLCDTAARWEFKGKGTNRLPNWVSYTGGDTLTAVEVTGPMAYLGGHNRWLNNPWAGDNPGSGAWPTEGLAVVDTRNGLPFSWNPGRDRGLGVLDFLPTASMLWAVSDTNNWAGEFRPRLAGFPVNNNQIPPDVIGKLPGDVWQLGAIPGAGAGDQRGMGFDGTTVEHQVTQPGEFDWTKVRGAFAVDDTVYTVWSDKTFTAQSWDGTDFGVPQDIDLYEGTPTTPGYSQNFINDLASMTGIFYEPKRARIYYTMQGSSQLFWRPFTPESQVVGAVRRTLGKVGALSPSAVKGMFLAGGYVYYADTSTGALRRVKLNGNKFGATVTTVNSAIDWRANALFLSSKWAVLADNVDPVAKFSVGCTGLSCSVDASKSADADGGLVDYSVDFGDGTVLDGPEVDHTYSGDGVFDITVTVTDNRGASTAKTSQVNVVRPPNVDPTADFSFDCWGLDCNFDATTSVDTDGSIVDYDWNFGDLASGAGETANHVYATGGTFDVELTVTDDRGGTASQTQQVSVNPIATSIEFRDATSVDGGNSQNVSIQVPATVQNDDLMMLFITNGNSRTADTPPGWTALGSRSDSELTTQVFWRFATAGSAGSNVTSVLRNDSLVGQAAPVVTTLAAYSGVDSPPVSASASALESSTTAVSAHTTPGISVPADGAWVLSYWSDRNSTANGNTPTTAWTPPVDQLTLADEFSSGSDLRVSSLLTHDGGPVLSGPRSGLTATANATATKATMWTIVLRSE